MQFPKSAPSGTSAIIIAGDMSSIESTRKWARFLIERYDLDVLFVPGNHEFYNIHDESRTLVRDRKFLRQLHEESQAWRRGFYVLDSGGAILGDVRVLGATLWSDMKLGLDNEAEIVWRIHEAQGLIPDYRKIRMRKDTPYTPQDTIELNTKSAKFLKTFLEKPFDGKTIVVTHHLPHPAVTPLEYVGHKANYLYANSKALFDDVMNSENAPALWVCGHAHQKMDVVVGSTRLVCNPYGYKMLDEEADNGFIWDFVVDV